MSAEGQEDPLDAQTLGSVLFTCAGVYWLILAVVTMARVVVQGLTLDSPLDSFTGSGGPVYGYSALKLVGIAVLAPVPILLAWLTIVYRGKLVGGALLEGYGRLPLSAAPLAAVGIRGLGLCLVLNAAREISIEGVSVMMMFLDASSHFLTYVESRASLFQLLLGTLLVWRARWLVDRLRTTPERST